jgi:hypothetical protein
MNGLNGRYYAGRHISAEFSPVTDFKEAKCRMFADGHCDRGGHCNFMHPKHVSKDLKKGLTKLMYQEYPDYKAAKTLREQDPEFVPKKRKLNESQIIIGMMKREMIGQGLIEDMSKKIDINTNQGETIVITIEMIEVMKKMRDMR